VQPNPATPITKNSTPSGARKAKTMNIETKIETEIETGMPQELKALLVKEFEADGAKHVKAINDFVDEYLMKSASDTCDDEGTNGWYGGAERIMTGMLYSWADGLEWNGTDAIFAVVDLTDFSISESSDDLRNFVIKITDAAETAALHHHANEKEMAETKIETEIKTEIETGMPQELKALLVKEFEADGAKHVKAINDFAVNYLKMCGREKSIIAADDWYDVVYSEVNDRMDSSKDYPSHGRASILAMVAMIDFNAVEHGELSLELREFLRGMAKIIKATKPTNRPTAKREEDEREAAKRAADARQKANEIEKFTTKTKIEMPIVLKALLAKEFEADGAKHVNAIKDSLREYEGVDLSGIQRNVALGWRNEVTAVMLEQMNLSNRRDDCRPKDIAKAFFAMAAMIDLNSSVRMVEFSDALRTLASEMAG
jgi:hypothetical protein